MHNIGEGAWVALLAEGVDRNTRPEQYTNPTYVALLAEGVDRNSEICTFSVLYKGRPPRGGRG